MRPCTAAALIALILLGAVPACAEEKKDEARGLPTGPAAAESAERWVPFGAADDGSARVYYLADSIRTVDEDKVSIITRREYVNDAVLEGVRYRTEIGRVTIDCALGRYAAMDASLLNADGDEVSRNHVEAEEMVFYAIPPASIVDKVRLIACAAAPKPEAKPDEPQLSTGTGWMTTKGYLVTANHVIAGAQRIVLYQNGREVGDAEVVSEDPANDVAILKPSLKHVTHVAIPISPRPAQLGAPVFTIGYPAPDVMGVSVKMTSGEVSAVAGIDFAAQRTDDVRLIQVSIPMQSGNSGGPVIDGAGQAVGIVVTKLQKTSNDEIAQNVNFALKAAYVRGLLAELPDVGGYRLVKPVTGRTALVGALQDAVFMILCVSPPGDHE
jgi:S1-C subfamily serine protease